MMFTTAVTVLDAACSAGVPVNLRGGPGIGKTSVVQAVADARDRHLETVLASVREPADFAGLPILTDDGTTVFAPPRWAKNVADNTTPSIVFFDEMSTAPPSVQAATLRVLTEHWVGDLLLPADTWLIAAMNPVDVVGSEVFRVATASGTDPHAVTVVACDATVLASYPATSRMPTLPVGTATSTDLRVGISHALTLRPHPAAIVVITDGFTPWPDTPPAVPVIVALVGTPESQAHATRHLPNWVRSVPIDLPEPVTTP